MVSKTTRRPEGRHSVRLAGFLIAYDGRAPHEFVQQLFADHGIPDRSIHNQGRGHGSRGSRIGFAINRASRPLRQAGLISRDGDDWVAADLADLADWLADQVAEDSQWENGDPDAPA